MSEPEDISPLQVSQAIRAIAPRIKSRRQWYAVFRTMADLNILQEDDYDAFINMITEELPQHNCLPTRAEMLRIAVQSFAKPMVLWNSDNAPVLGKRFNEYLKIAKETKELLKK